MDGPRMGRSRRDMLRAMGITAAAGLLAASCGDDDDDDVASGGASTTGGTGTGTGGRRGRPRQLPGDAGVGLRVRQPRDDEPVLRPDAVRRRGRLGAARHRRSSGRAPRPPTSPRWSMPSKRRSPATPTGSRSRSSISRRSTIRSTRRLEAGIPVVSYNADAANGRMAYVGQDLYGSGFEMGNRIVEIVGEGPVALFIATPGQLNIQPRIDGAIDAIEESGANDRGRGHRHRRRARGGAQRHRGLLPRPHRRGRACSQSTPAAPKGSARSCRPRTRGQER